jgi:hypothetical protein
MTLSPVERMVDSFVAYVKAELPLRLIQANAGKAVAAPVLKKIEKTVKVDVQYFPCAAVNFESADFEITGQGAMQITGMVDVLVFAADSKPERLSVVVERYLDAVIDLASSAGSWSVDTFELWPVRADKGIEPDGSRGWAVVQFLLKGEVDY